MNCSSDDGASDALATALGVSDAPGEGVAPPEGFDAHADMTITTTSAELTRIRPTLPTRKA